MTRYLQGIAAWGGIGYALQAAGLSMTDTLFWCVVVLAMVLEYLARTEGRDQGILMNGIAVLHLKEQVEELTEKLRQHEQSIRNEQ